MIHKQVKIKDKIEQHFEVVMTPFSSSSSQFEPNYLHDITFKIISDYVNLQQTISHILLNLKVVS